MVANTLSNDYVSSIAGETVSIGGGVPIIETQDTDQKVKVKLKFKCSDGSTTNIKYKVSDTQFVNNNFATGAVKFIENGSVNAGTETTFEVTREKKGLIWITYYADSTSDIEAAIDTFAIALAS